MNFFKIILIFITVQASAGSLPRFELFERNGCEYKKNYQFLSKDKKQTLEKKLDRKLNTRTIRRLDVDCKTTSSRAYILNDKVRTHYQTLLVWVENQKLKALEILEFTEPVKYKAPTEWYNSLKGISDQKLLEVDALSGATLTRQSTLKLVKQALYFDE